MFRLAVCCLIFFSRAIAQEENAIDPCDNQGIECILPSLREEKKLFSQISSESRRLYNSLDCKGKNRAIELAKESSDKNEAVQQAAREMGKRQQTAYPNQETYPYQIDRQAGQKPYRRRFGY